MLGRLSPAGRHRGAARASPTAPRYWNGARRQDRRRDPGARAGIDKRKAFTAAFGTDDMDASVLLLPELGLIDADDPRFVSTVAAIERELRARPPCDALCRRRRFRPAGDGVPGLPLLADRRAVGAGPARGGARAVSRMRLRLRNRYGLLSEDIHPADRRAVGQFPPDLFHGRVDPDAPCGCRRAGRTAIGAGLHNFQSRWRSRMRGAHAGGLEVVLKADAQASIPASGSAGAARVSRRRSETRTIVEHGDVTYIVTDLTQGGLSRNITTASPTACCGRSCIIGSTWRNSPAAISRLSAGQRAFRRRAGQGARSPTTSSGCMTIT